MLVEMTESRTQRGSIFALLLICLVGPGKRVDRVCGQNCGQIKVFMPV